MELNLVKEEELVGLTKPWPLKDATSIWKQLQTMGSKDFNILVLGYLTNTEVKHKRGRETELERLAKSILFEMSEKQRMIAYGIINKRANFMETKGWWKNDLIELCKPASSITVNRRTHRSTGFTHTLLDKKKTIHSDYIYRVKLFELKSTICDYKEWLVVQVETEDGIDRVGEIKFTDYNKALEFYKQS